MARQRTIHPELYDSPEVGALSIGARLLFIGLFSVIPDDDGRGTADPRELNRIIFGFDNFGVTQVSKWLKEIEVNLSSSVVFYETNDKRPVYSLTNWRRWQKVQHPSKSKIPPPTGATK